jgi:hypothetical protein
MDLVHRVALAALLVMSVAPSRAEVRILSSPGGKIGPYLNLFSTLRESGERVVIDGPCLSACTLVLSVMPRNRICVTRRAVLGFHGAWSRDEWGRKVPEPEASRIVLSTYPPAVREWIRRRGRLGSRVLLLRGRELAAMFPVCR